MKESSKARLRRAALGWYDTYLKGLVLDIGCGDDLVVSHATPYDLEQGDAQELDGIQNESFDAVYSSHCLEHMRDPRAALRRWWECVRPGGWLIVVVPDEDLYEQGYWPSMFNSDHKATFSLNKDDSWSPVHYDLAVLVGELPGQKLISAATISTDYPIGGCGIVPLTDHTVGGAEAALEVVVQKDVEKLKWRTTLRNTPVCPNCGRLEMIARGTIATDSSKLDVMCSHCGTFGVVTLAS